MRISVGEYANQKERAVKKPWLVVFLSLLWSAHHEGFAPQKKAKAPVPATPSRMEVKPPPSLTPAHAGHQRTSAWKALPPGASFVISAWAKTDKERQGGGGGGTAVLQLRLPACHAMCKKRGQFTELHRFQNPKAPPSEPEARLVLCCCDHFIDQYPAARSQQLMETFNILSPHLSFHVQAEETMSVIFFPFVIVLFGPWCFCHCLSLLAFINRPL